MKRSVDFRISPLQHVKDRKRAERAVGHPLKPSQPVHHFSETQLVVCEDAEYHSLLHEAAYYKRLEADPDFAEAEIAKIEARTERAKEECQILRAIINRVHPESLPAIDAALAKLSDGATFAEAYALIDDATKDWPKQPWLKDGK